MVRNLNSQLTQKHNSAPLTLEAASIQSIVELGSGSQNMAKALLMSDAVAAIEAFQNYSFRILMIKKICSLPVDDDG